MVDETPGWGSDAIAALVADLDFKYVTLVPGASYRGLHDSLVNYLGNRNPAMLLCLHEEHAIAIAHGYAKVTEKPLLTIVHSNVGLMHATMAIFNAWCDRVPMLILGATGPVDAMNRRPWIDWIHTTQDEGALVRGYTKWDDRPASVEAALESILRAWQMSRTLPCGPTYVVLDSDIQEQKLARTIARPDPKRFAAPHVAYPAPEDVKAAAALLGNAANPMIMTGRVSRKIEDWQRRIALAERLNAHVVSDFKTAASFPTDHPLHVGAPGNFLDKELIAALRQADVVLNLDTFDFGGSMRQVWGKDPIPLTIISCSLDRYVHNGWSMDHQSLPTVDLDLAVDPDAFTAALLNELGQRPSVAGGPKSRDPKPTRVEIDTIDQRIGLRTLALEVNAACAGRDVCFIRLPLGMYGGYFTLRHPLDFLGSDGGGGIGAGPGMAVGAALALRGTGRLPVAILGDGDYLMAVTALWTAVANEIPLLVVVANNRSFFNDEVHQERVARSRERPVENKWIGQRIDDPAPELAGLARNQGAVGIGPVDRRADLADALRKAIADVEAGKVVVVEVVVTPGYDVGVGGVLSGGTVERKG